MIGIISSLLWFVACVITGWMIASWFHKVVLWSCVTPSIRFLCRIRGHHFHTLRSLGRPGAWEPCSDDDPAAEAKTCCWCGHFERILSPWTTRES